jgi:hypothetical protein
MEISPLDLLIPRIAFAVSLAVAIFYRSNEYSWLFRARNDHLVRGTATLSALFWLAALVVLEFP